MAVSCRLDRNMTITRIRWKSTIVMKDYLKKQRTYTVYIVVDEYDAAAALRPSSQIGS